MEIKKIMKYKDNIYYWKEGDFHSHQGMIAKEDIEKATTTVTTKSDKTLSVAEANVNDQLEKMQRGPQIVMPKDIGYIIIATGIDKTTKVIEAGTGCGIAAIHFARHAQEVISYEIKEEHITIAKKNLQKCDITNVTIKHKDISQGIEEIEIDVIFLDLPEPEKVIEHAYNSLKQGGYLAVYLPTMTQIATFLKTNERFYIEEVTELIKRNWSEDATRLRPKSEQVAHTAFIIVARKI